ncbi:YdhK family protein [Bacillus solitudinis]|uniref:YdhK family protein n=1 Tax=Bacillus solitudinis TaxID=2014074 RepID=UPI000C233EB5|nr:YdhK family protein [Bacillus solitudinis]
MKKSKLITSILLFLVVFTLVGCNSDEEETNSPESEEQLNMDSEENMDEESSHMGMNHSGSGEVPNDLQVAENPTYEVGSRAIIQTDHMEGMQGAEATIVGAYSTTAYVITYTPTTGDALVENHKWVIHEELENAKKSALEAGAEVTLDAEHMEGMDGATAEVDSAEETTVYMVDFIPTTGGEVVKNHKWVTEAELSAE